MRMNLPWVNHKCKTKLKERNSSVDQLKTYETRRVVVLDGFRVTERLENGIGLEQLLFQFALLRRQNELTFLKLKVDNTQEGCVRTKEVK